MRIFFAFVFLLILLIGGCVQEPSVESSSLGEAAGKALGFLEKQQLQSGEFVTYFSLEKDMENYTLVSSPFITTFVAHSLGFVDAEAAKKMREKSRQFIESQMNEKGTWNFFGNAGETPFGEMPDDLDCTATAVAALTESGKRMETSFEAYRAKNGAFFTWMTKEENDIDCVVNANILFLYGLQRKEDARLCNYLNQTIESQQYTACTNYYSVTLYAFAYTISRAFADANAQCLRKSLPYLERFLLSKQQNGKWGNDLDNALATISLINIGFRGKELDSAIQHIVKSQKADGSWESEAFFTGPPKCRQREYCVYFGSSELVTALSLEAIAKYEKLNKKEDSD